MKRFHLICILLTCFSSSFADNLYVPSIDYPTIQSAINDANDGDTVIVAPDRYKENINFLGKAITVTSTDPNDPNIVAATIIDGNEPNDVNFASVVTFNSGEDNNSVLTGFTITGGTGTWLLDSWEFSGLNWNRCGGGVMCYNMSAPAILKNYFTNNIAAHGGGIYIYGDPVNPDNPANPAIHISPIIEDNIFVNNVAVIGHGFSPPDTNYPGNDHGDGGAIASFQGCDAIITNNVFHDNAAYAYGGAIHLRQWCNGLIESNNFTDNSSQIGGAIHITYSASPYVVGNYIESNHSGSGGAIYVYYLSEPVINYNIIRLNSSSNGIIGMHYGSGGELKNNIIEKNTDGATIILTGSSPAICHNTIYDNEKYGILCNGTASPEIENNIISGTRDGYAIAAGSLAEPTIRYNDVWNNELGNYGPNVEDLTGIEGNISLDPQFIDDSGPFLHVHYTSPCIHAGDPNFVSEAGETDIYSYARITNGRTDIGAEETLPVWNLTAKKLYFKIQDAINDSNDNEVIIAGKGRYFETIDFGTHQIVLSSIDPNDWNCVEDTIIDANNEDTALVIAGGQDANTIFRGFTVTNGNALDGHAGGIYCQASPRIERNIIYNNYSFYKGGGMYFYSNECSPLVTDNRIINNLSDYGGAVFCDTDSEVTLTNNQITDNYATFAGGGISCGVYVGRTWIINNEIIANSSLNGGGLASENLENQINLYGNLFCGNYASGRGGAILTMYGDPNIINNSIVNNRSTTGSGISIETGSAPQIINNIVAFNQLGHGIYCSGSQPYPIDVISNDVYGNALGNYGGTLTDQTGTNGNISIDPNLVNIGYWQDPNTPVNFDDDVFIGGNFHLFPVSACIDAADNNYLPAQLQTDIDGEERTFGEILDIGADEFVINPYDLNFDGIVDYYELSILTDEWLQDGNDLQTDFYDDDYIDFLDFAKLAKQWFWQAPWYTEQRQPALQFETGSGGYVWVHTPDGCILNNVFTFTYTAWIYPFDFSQTNARIIGKNERAFMISTGGVLKGYSHGGGIPNSTSVTGTLQTNKWCFVSMTYDFYSGDQLIDLYVNGEEVNYQTHSIGVIERPPLPDWVTEGQWDLTIGTAAWSKGAYIPNAIIDEVAIYDRVLTQEEMQYLYNNGFGFTRPDAESLNPIGLWHFDEGQGTTVFDSSGYGNDGQLQGTILPQRVKGKFFKY